MLVGASKSLYNQEKFLDCLQSSCREAIKEEYLEAKAILAGRLIGEDGVYTLYDGPSKTSQLSQRNINEGVFKIRFAYYKAFFFFFFVAGV
jgi:hypothetical protein